MKNKILAVIAGLMLLLAGCTGVDTPKEGEEKQEEEDMDGAKAVCGNGECEPPESRDTCPSDCEIPPPPMPPGS